MVFQIAAAIREGSTHRLQYGEQLAASEVLNLAEAVGTSFASRTPEASVAFCKWVLLFPPDSDSLLLRDCLLGPRCAHPPHSSSPITSSLDGSSGPSVSALTSLGWRLPYFFPCAAVDACICMKENLWSARVEEGKVGEGKGGRERE